MKIALFGATGQTGQFLLPLLIEAGHNLTVLVRTPEKLHIDLAQLTVIQGDARNAADVRNTVNGQDMVASTFGTHSLKKADIQETFMRNLVAAMTACNVKRLIDLSAWGAGDSHETSGFGFKLLQATVLKNMYVDKNRGEALLSASDIDYLLVRPGRLTNAPAKGHVRSSLDGKDLSTAISRRDVASFMLEQTQAGSWSAKALLIGY